MQRHSQSMGAHHAVKMKEDKPVKVCITLMKLCMNGRHFSARASKEKSFSNKRSGG